jgi:putative glutathione S-transferase
MDDLKSRPDDETTFVPQAPNSFHRGPCNVQNWLDANDCAEFPPEPGRYHLFLNYGCGWCHQVLQVLELRKIDSNGVSKTHVGCYRDGARNTPEYKGWAIQVATEGSTGRSFNCMRDVYNAFDGNYGLEQLTIPVLYDKKNGQGGEQ